MSLNSITRIIFCLAFCFQLQSQNDSISQDNTNSKIHFLFDDERQSLGSVSFTYQLPMAYGDNFIGKGFEAKGGYNFRANIYVYKNLFVGFAFGASNFDVKNIELVGNYQSTSIKENYFNVGYEFLPIPKVRLGIYVSLGGEASLLNNLEGDFSNRDSGKFQSYGVNVNYEFIENLNLFAEYGWKQVKTNIKVPGEISPFFEKGTYRTLNFGLQFNFGDKDLVDKIVF